MPKARVLYIGGYSRSGSTLLLRLLGSLPGLFCVGEVWDIWRRSFMENQLCGCGASFHSCEFWNAVVREAFGSADNVNGAAMQQFKTVVEARQSLPFLMMPSLRTPAYQRRLAEYGKVLQALYDAIQKVSGCDVIVDSSKVAPYAFVLRSVPSIDLFVAHLVRDSRATAYSWQRQKVRPEIHWTTAYMERYGVVRSALEWDAYNVLLQLIQMTGVPYVRLRYEDFVLDPYRYIGQIAKFLGMPDAAGRHHASSVELPVQHTVSGNPMRFQTGTVQVRPDIEWQARMTQWHKALVTLLSWPLLSYYGYLVPALLDNEAELLSPEEATPSQSGVGPRFRGL